MAVSKNQKWWNNGLKNVRAEVCPAGFVPGRLKFQRSAPSQQTIEKRVNTRKQNNIPAWNRGVKTGPESQETRRKKSLSAIGNQNAAGTPSWNSGLTAETDERVFKYANAQKGQSRQGNYISGKEHPNWRDDREDFLRYRYEVSKVTERNYREFREEINPHQHKRGLAGEDGAYHLDHIVPVRWCFENNISADIAGSIDNLQMMLWEENLSKSDSVRAAAIAQLMGEITDWN